MRLRTLLFAFVVLSIVVLQCSSRRAYSGVQFRGLPRRHRVQQRYPWRTPTARMRVLSGERRMVLVQKIDDEVGYGHDRILFPQRQRHYLVPSLQQAKRGVDPSSDDEFDGTPTTTVDSTPIPSTSTAKTTTVLSSKEVVPESEWMEGDERDADAAHGPQSDGVGANRADGTNSWPLLGRHPAILSPSSMLATRIPGQEQNHGDGESYPDFAAQDHMASANSSATGVHFHERSQSNNGDQRLSRSAFVIPALSCTGAVALFALVAAGLVWRKRRASRNSLKDISPPKIMIKSPSSPNLTTNGIPFVLPYVSIPPLKHNCLSEDESTIRGNYRRRIGVTQLDQVLVSPEGVSHSTLSPPSVWAPRRASRDVISGALAERNQFDRNLFEFYPTLEDDDHPLCVGENVAGIPHSESGNSIGIGLGRVGFSLSYCLESEELKIFIIGASNLPAKAKKGSVDPFIRITLVPDKHPKHSTKIKRNALSPSFEEEFTFPLKKTFLEGKMLKLKICDHDKFSRRYVIGYVAFPLKDAGIKNGMTGDTRTAEIWRDIQETLELDLVRVSFGEVLLCLKYDPNSGLLSIDVIQARELKFQKESTASMQNDGEAASSVYAKVTLYEGKRVIKTKKTDVRKNTRDPIFNENFSIHVPRSYLSDIYADVTLWHKGRLGRKRMIGRTAVGPFTYVSGTGLEQWEDMLHQPDAKVSQWHSLYQ